MITLQHATENIIPVTAAIDGDFVGIAVKLNNEGIAVHTGIFIKHSSNRFILHFIPDFNQPVRLIQVPDQWYYHKTLSLIDPKLVLSFRSYCEQIIEHANPQYGYVYAGSLYDENGNFFSDIDAPEIMTCVGFCISVIKGYLKADEYFQYTDWSAQNFQDDPYLEDFITRSARIYPAPQMTTLRNNLRRILPSELLTAAFLEKTLPVRRDEITPNLPIIEQALIQKIG